MNNILTKNVGIVTMVGADNYGNALQNYAVQVLIEKNGYNAKTLLDKTKKGFQLRVNKEIPVLKKFLPSYISEYLRDWAYHKYGCKNDRDFTLIAFLNAKRTIKTYYATKTRRHEAFEAFRHEMIKWDDAWIDNKSFDKEHYNQYYAFVCGSDQVWGPHYATTSMVSFLQFAPEYKRIAFAPSFGAAKIPESRVNDYARWIASIPSLSVREEAGANIIRELTGREAKVLLDPTFGLTASQWHDFARQPKKMPKKPFAFCYFLGNMCRKYERYIKKTTDEYGWQLICTWDIQDLDYYDIGPREFVWLIANAQMVFTDSFHGTALSINLQKAFVVFERDEGGTSMSSRISSVLKIVGLETRKFPLPNNEILTNIDYSKTSSDITNERLKIESYLKESLEHIKDRKQWPLLASRYHCTGCGACVNICSVKALKMKRDFEGFLYPELDSTKCVTCHLCEKACPADNPQLNQKYSFPKAYWAYAKSNDICQKSSSGGIFTLLAEVILLQGGVVYGAGYDSQFNVIHRRIDRKEDLYQLRTSKYVQSDTGSIYKDVQNELKFGRPVLFTGTPCQVAALKSYLGNEYPNLFTQDIICHGVPSPGVWQEYLEQVHCSKGKTIMSISFRDKTVGWNDFSMKVQYDDGSSYRELAVKDPFERAFLANLILRPSCHQCQYKTLNRCSDITLADYWGVEIVHPELKNQQGVSLVLIQSAKGQKVFEKISEYSNHGETNCERAVRMNAGCLKSPAIPPRRQDFFKEWTNGNLPKLVSCCLRLSFISLCRRQIIRNGARVKTILRKLHILSSR